MCTPEYVRLFSEASTGGLDHNLYFMLNLGINLIGDKYE